MSASEHKLTVKVNEPAAEISVVDGTSSKVVASGIGELQEVLPRGLYKLRVRVGPSVKDQLVCLDQDRDVSLDSLAFPSPIPPEGTSKSHKRHRAYKASSTRRAKLGSGGSVLVFSRGLSVQGNDSQSSPGSGLTFRDATGTELANIGNQADLDRYGDAAAVLWGADVTPGPYLLRLELSDGTGLERPLFITVGMQTQIFLLQRDYMIEGKAERRADLASGAVAISPDQHFHPANRATRLSELAGYALTQHRRILSPVLLNELLRGIFEDPMLGLIGAHLILRDSPEKLPENPKGSAFDTCTNRLLQLLGPDHPDLQALWWKRAAGPPLGDGRLHSIPMLRASWDLAVEKSFQDAHAIALDPSSAAKILGMLPGAPWLLWLVEARNAKSKVRVPSDVLRGYLHARAESSRVVRPTQESVGMNAAAHGKRTAGKKSASPRTLRKKSARSQANVAKTTNVATPPAGPALDNDEKFQLARNLGLPSDALEATLKEASS